MRSEDKIWKNTLFKYMRETRVLGWWLPILAVSDGAAGTGCRERSAGCDRARWILSASWFWHPWNRKEITASSSGTTLFHDIFVPKWFCRLKDLENSKMYPAGRSHGMCIENKQIINQESKQMHEEKICQIVTESNNASNRPELSSTTMSGFQRDSYSAF